MRSGKLTRCSRSQRARALNARDSRLFGWSWRAVNCVVSVGSENATVRGMLAPGDRGNDRDLILAPDLAAELVGRQYLPVQKQPVHLAHASFPVEQHRPEIRTALDE